MTRYSEPLKGESSTIIFADVASCNCLITEPCFPMTPPTREVWHNRRKQVVVNGVCWVLWRLGVLGIVSEVVMGSGSVGGGGAAAAVVVAAV